MEVLAIAVALERDPLARTDARLLRADPRSSRPSGRGRRGRAQARGAVLVLTREEQYAHQQPSLTAKKMRLLEIQSGAPTLKGRPTGVWATREKMREAEKALALQAEASYVRTVRDWQAAAPKNVGASVTPERA